MEPLPLVAIEAAAEEGAARVRALLEPRGYRLVGRYCWTPTWLWEPAGGA